MSSEEDDPKKRTGRYRGLQPAWQKGSSANPKGRPKRHKEMVEKLRANADEITDSILALFAKGREGKLTQSDKIFFANLWECWDRMFGRPAQAVLVGGNLDIGDGGDGSGLSVLLQRAIEDFPNEHVLRRELRDAIEARALADTAVKAESLMCEAGAAAEKLGAGLFAARRSCGF